MSEAIHRRPVEVLMVEDSVADATLTRVALKDTETRQHFHLVHDGVDALAYLRKERPFLGACRPDMVLMDINMPRKNGLETLAAIRQDPNLCDIPVVILSTSAAAQDIALSYALHASCFIVKPTNLDEYMDVVKRIEEFWLTVVRYPKHGGLDSDCRETVA